MAFIPRIGPDRIKCAEFPSVVLESGWQESTSRHFDDARLWQEGSGNQVRVVVQVKFLDMNECGRIHLVLSVSRAHPDGLGGTIFPTNYASFFSFFFLDPTVISRPLFSVLICEL